MFVMMSIHKPHAQYETDLIESMHRFGAAAKSQPGLIQAHTLKDAASGNLVGLAIWESLEAAKAAMPVMGQAVVNDDFDTWESEEIRSFRLVEV